MSKDAAIELLCNRLTKMCRKRDAGRLLRRGNKRHVRNKVGSEFYDPTKLNDGLWVAS